MSSKIKELRAFTNEETNTPEIQEELTELEANLVTLSKSVFNLEEKLKPILKAINKENQAFGVGMKGQAGGEYGPSPLTELLRKMNYSVRSLEDVVEGIENRVAV